MNATPNETFDREHAKALHALSLVKSPEKIEEVYQAKAQLKALVDALEKGNPIQSFLNSGVELSELSSEYAFLSYKIAEPSIKELNDDILGPSLTDEFIAGLQQIITEGRAGLGQKNAHVLKTSFKGGLLLARKESIKNPPQGYDDTAVAFNAMANEYFLEFLAERIAEEKCAENPDTERIKKLQKVAYKYGTEQSNEALDDYKPTEQEDKDRSSLRLNFGAIELDTEARDLKTVITGAILSECITNMIRYRQEGQTDTQNQRSRFQKMTFEEFIKYLSADYQQAYKRMLELKQKAIRDNIADANLFDQSDTQDIFFLKPGVVKSYRHKTLKEDYGCSDEAYEAIKEFYDVVNIVDVLKPFLGEHIEGYAAYQELLNQKLRESKEALERGNLQELKQQIFELQKYARVSEKDPTLHEQRGEISEVTDHRFRTFADTMHAIMGQQGDTDVVYTDLIGFGAYQYYSLSLTLYRIARKLGLATQKSRDNSKSHAAVQVRNVDVKDEVVKYILSTGDTPATTVLNMIRTELANLECVESVNADGGDEILLVLKEGTTKAQIEDLKRTLKNNNVRAVRYTLNKDEIAAGIANSKLKGDKAFEDMKKEGEPIRI